MSIYIYESKKSSVTIILSAETEKEAEEILAGVVNPLANDFYLDQVESEDINDIVEDD